MVTVGSGKERFPGPSALERLHQGSQARIKLLEAARQAELARKVTPIADLTSGQLTKKRLGLVAGGAAGVVTLVALAACGGGSEADRPDPLPNRDFTQLSQVLNSCPNFPSFDGGDEQACSKLTVEAIACLDGNLLSMAVDPNETIDKIAQCVASEAQH